MRDDGRNRISVLRDSHLVPLLPSAPLIGKEQPWRGVLLERHTVSVSEIPQHEHREFCLHLQISGEEPVEWWSEGRHGVERTAPGSMILLPPGTRDRIVWHGASERLILSFRSSVLDEMTDASELLPAEFTSHWSLHDPALQRLVAEMGREAAAGWPLGGLYADLVTISFASHLLRRHAADAVDLGEVKGGMPVPRLRRVMEYITENIGDDLRLEAMAHEIGLSPFHFAREFRAATGQTPYQYLLDQRIERAKGLLRTGTLPVQEIALMTGFRSPVNFVRSFRQRVGQPPGDWRKSA